MNIYEFGALCGMLLVGIGALLIFYILPAIWTWKDAKSRGLSPILWTLVVVLLQTVGGFICFGLVLYLIVRCVLPKIKCPECNQMCDHKAVFCSNCGKAIDYSKVEKYPKKHNKWLWGLLVGLAVMILGGGIFCVSTYYSIPESFPNTSIGKIENSWNDVWTVKAVKSNETLNKNIHFKDEDHGTLIVEGSCSTGTVTLNVIGDTTVSYVLSDIDDSVEIDLNTFNTDRVELMLVNTAVEDLEFKADWSGDK